jgi:hypothetical protein
MRLRNLFLCVVWLIGGSWASLAQVDRVVAEARGIT